MPVKRLSRSGLMVLGIVLLILSLIVAGQLGVREWFVAKLKTMRYEKWKNGTAPIAQQKVQATLAHESGRYSGSSIGSALYSYSANFLVSQRTK